MTGGEFNRQKEMFSFIDPDEYLDAAHFIWFHPSQAWTSNAQEIDVMKSTSLLFHTLATCGHLTGKRALPILAAVGISGAADRLQHLLTNPIYCGKHNMALFEGIIHILAQLSLQAGALGIGVSFASAEIPQALMGRFWSEFQLVSERFWSQTLGPLMIIFLGR